MLQTILGASGVIGIELARELHQRGHSLRVVSRHPPSLNLKEERVSADLLDKAAVDKAIAGSSVVYLTAGLPYDVRIWKCQWPVIIENVLSACRAHKARLVFFDNVYMYGPVSGWMTEQTPIHPSSEKGRIRAALAKTLLTAAERGEVDVRIARAADFYGPGATNGLPNLLVFAPLVKGKSPQWLASGKFRHSVTFTLDAAKATAELGLRDSLPQGQRVWHVPTDAQALTGEEWARNIAEALAVPPKSLQLLKPWMTRLLGIFVRPVYELNEMMYQYDRDYLFSSEAFEKAFGLRPTPYRQGIAATAKSYTNSSADRK